MIEILLLSLRNIFTCSFSLIWLFLLSMFYIFNIFLKYDLKQLKKFKFI